MAVGQRDSFVIVGANVAGGYAAHELRQQGFDGRVVLIGEDQEPPYDRPPLSKEYLRGESPREKLFPIPPEFYRDNDIDLRLGVRVARIDLGERQVELATGERVSYHRLLLATGGKVRRLNVPGAGLEGVHYLRTLGDSERLRSELAARRKLVVIGAGFIGAEVAASARMMGLEVTVIELEEVPLSRALGPEAGRIYADIHRDHGVDLRTGERVAELAGSGRIEAVVTADGTRIDCDLVVVGVGIDPETSLAEGTALRVDNGIVVDEFCETSVPGVFAAGDVARFYSPVLGESIRVEHWDVAVRQGAAAARNMLGKREPYAEVPWFWSDQYDTSLQYVGHASSWDEVVFRGDVAGRSFTAFYLKDSRLRAALAVNKYRDIRPSRELIRLGVPVDPGKLRDEAVDLKSLAPPQ